MRSVAACGVVAGALLVGTGSAADAAPSAEGAATRPCGYSEDPPNAMYWAYWNNCGDSSEKINVDVMWWPDHEVCVRPHSYMNLGQAGTGVQYVRGATYLWPDCSPYDN